MKQGLGSRISEMLERNAMSQKELAKKIGVTEASMSRYINGERTPRGVVVADIAKALHTTTDYLLGRESDEDPELAYCRAKRAVIRYARTWTREQKAALVSAIFMADETGAGREGDQHGDLS